jgi:ATP-binding cassette subfamily F protein uup
VLSDGNSSNDDLMKAGAELAQIMEQIDAKTERWLELSEFA